MCECVCVCVCFLVDPEIYRNMKYFRRGQGTFLHLTPSERSQETHMELQGWPAYCAGLKYSQSLPCCFSSVPHEKFRRQEAQLQRILASECPWCSYGGGRTDSLGEQPLWWEWGLALQRLWRKESCESPTKLDTLMELGQRIWVRNICGRKRRKQDQRRSCETLRCRQIWQAQTYRKLQSKSPLRSPRVRHRSGKGCCTTVLSRHWLRPCLWLPAGDC